MSRARFCRRLIPLLIVLALSPACRPADGDDARRDDRPAGASAEAAPTPDELANATYGGFEGIEPPVTLADGRWEGEPFVPGAASRPVVHLVRGLRLAGDLDGDGSDEAVVLLGQNSGGSGEFLYLAVVGRGKDRVESIDTARIGDRIQIRGARIDGGRVFLDVVRAGPGDAACCPGELATLGWEMAEQGLAPFVASAETGRLALDTIGDTEWVLREWNRNEPAEDDPRVTLTYADGRFIGHGGCNRYFAPADPGQMPGEVSVGPVGSTRMACPEQAMTVEARFLKQLAGVGRFGFMAGRLALTYEADGARGVMLFDGRGPVTKTALH